jgi:Raf kinase inhibitor-like YbhB/YbcL family protein
MTGQSFQLGGFHFRGAAAVLAFLALVISGCSSDSKLASNSDLSGGLWSISVTSPAFNNGGMIPIKYTQDGEDVSPPIEWSGGPGGTKEFVLIVQDPDAPGNDPYLHWFVYRIPATTHKLSEGAAGKSNPNGDPNGSTLMQGKNYLGRIGYAGPKPPPGSTHRYFFQVFALDTPQDWTQGMERSTVREKFRGHVLSKGVLVAHYKSER